MGHLIVGSAELETENGEQILSFEENLAFQSVAKINGMLQWSLVHHLVDTRRQY
jgi:hypothetical protein